MANTTVGVEALGATVDAAMADAEARMNSVLAALKQMGIADKDIQTSNFSMNFDPPHRHVWRSVCRSQQRPESLRRVWHGLPERGVHRWGVCRANPDHARRRFADDHTPHERSG